MQVSRRSLILPDVALTYIPTQKFKTGYLSLSLLRPLDKQEAALNSLLPEVLLQGSARLPDMQAISDHLDELYGAGLESMNRRRGEVHLIGLFADCVDDRYTPEGTLEPVIETMAELLLDPALENGAFREDYVQMEQQNLIRAIQAQINDKRSYASRRLLELMFPNEAYGIDRRGTEEAVAAITPRSLYEHYRRILAGSRVELFYLGGAEEDRVADCFRNALKDLPRTRTDQVGTQVVRRAGETREFVETADVTQGKLVMGLRTDCTGDQPDYPALMLLNGVLGGTVSSKLFRNVREAMSLCYYASSGIDKAKGIMTISAGIAFEDYEVAKQAILQQLEDCRQGNITSDELTGARSYLRSTLQIAKDSPSRQEELSIGQALGIGSGDVDGQIQALDAVTLDQVRAAANRLSLDTIYFMKGENADAAV